MVEPPLAGAVHETVEVALMRLVAVTLEGAAGGAAGTTADADAELPVPAQLAATTDGV